MRKRCNWVSCDHDMEFEDSNSLNYILVCPHCGHTTRDQNEALSRIGRARFTKFLFSVSLVSAIAYMIWSVIS